MNILFLCTFFFFFFFPKPEKEGQVHRFQSRFWSQCWQVVESILEVVLKHVLYKAFKAKLSTQYCIYVVRKFPSLFKGKCVCYSLPSVKCLHTFVSRTERPWHFCGQLIFLVHQICQTTDPTNYTSTLQVVFVALLWSLIFHVYYWIFQYYWNEILVMGIGDFLNFGEVIFLLLFFFDFTITVEHLATG